MDMLKYVEDRGASMFSLPGIGINSLISFRASLSSGINQFAPPKLYTDCFLKEIQSSQFIKNYTLNNGYPALVEALKYYEKLLGTEDFSVPDKFADNLCVTAGATPAIVFYFEYYSMKYPKSNVLLLGLNYYLFYECCTRYQLNGITLTSKEKNRVAPTIDEIAVAIEKEKPKLLILTVPFNPSGEIYTEDELRKIVNITKKHDCLLLVDKCQLEEFASVFEYMYINKIIIEEDYVENTIIINSISKTRSLPGARLGYITANKEAMAYVTYLNELYYFNPPMVYITPFVADLLFRIVFIKEKSYSGKIDISSIAKMFRNFILTSAGLEVYNNFFKPVLRSPIIKEDIYNFGAEIDTNYKIVYSNYQYIREKLKKYIWEVTELQGGFNFCIKLNKTSSRDQLQFCADVTNAIKVTLLPESKYNNNQVIDSDEPFWIRITAAFPENEFTEMIDRFGNYMDSL